jgi:hypothetical protein
MSYIPNVNATATSGASGGTAYGGQTGAFNINKGPAWYVWAIVAAVVIAFLWRPSARK